MDDGLSGLRMYLAYNGEDPGAAARACRDGVGYFRGRTPGRRNRRQSPLFAHHREVDSHERGYE